MNDIKLWTFTLLVSAMIAAIFENLTPSSQKKQLGYILQMFILLCLIAPAAGWLSDRPKIDLSTVQEQAIEALDTNEILKAQFEAKMTELISNKLEMLGIFPREIGIDFSVSENAVEVSGIYILLEPKDSQRQNETKKELESFLGIAVQTAIYGEVK
ncbi:MAG: hypothetical protein K0S22_2533 [Oscillospiraceae bacterium]|jgi:hypothetical protein|nr:hypothetical protein [Oscillospiraceae bacterium]